MNIALFGTFDVDNYGDCLFPDIFIRAIEKRAPAASISCYSPTDKLSDLCSIDVLHSISGDFNDNEFSNKLSSYDAVVLAGGDTIWSGTRAGTYSKLKINSMSAGMRLWAWPLIAQGENTAGIILAPGVGNLSSDSLDILKKNSTDYKYFSLRDNISKDKISSNIKVDPDIAFNLPELFSDDELALYMDKSKVKSDEYIVFQFSSTYNTKILNDIFDALLSIATNEDKDIILLPLCNFLGDYYLLKNLAKKYSSSSVNIILYKANTSLEMMSVLALSSGYVGTSLHGAVTAYAYGKKSFIVTSKKQTKHRGVFGVVTSSEYLFIESPSEFKNNWSAYNLSIERENALKACLWSSTVFDDVFSSIGRGNVGIDIRNKIGAASKAEIESISLFAKVRILLQKSMYSSKKILPLFNYLKFRVRSLIC